MSFTVTSHSITVRPDSVLTAQCQRSNGDWQDSSITLDGFLGNNNGSFLLGGDAFSTSASDVRISCNTGGPTTLHAELRREDGSWHKDSINLDNFICNDDGNLRLQLPHFDRTIEELMDMSSSTEPYVEGVHSASIESMVSECGTAAKALENAIHTDISQGATLALKSLNAAFDAIDHACTLLRDVKTDTREAMKVQAHQLNSHFAAARQDWVEIEEIAARASQNTKNFQHTTLDQTIKSIGSVEMELSGQMNKTRLAKVQIEGRLASLKQQLNTYREAATQAKSQSQDAHNRTVIFSIVSVTVILAPLFIPLAIGASKDREQWEASEAKFTDQIKRIEDMLEISRIMLLNQENAFEEAEKIEKRCKELRNRTKGFQSDLVRLEYRISDLKKSLTDYSQRLSDVDTNSVTPLRYLLTLEEGRTMLEDAKRVRADMVGLDSRCGFLDM